MISPKISDVTITYSTVGSSERPSKIVNYDGDVAGSLRRDAIELDLLQYSSKIIDFGLYSSRSIAFISLTDSSGTVLQTISAKQTTDLLSASCINYDDRELFISIKPGSKIVVGSSLQLNWSIHTGSSAVVRKTHFCVSNTITIAAVRMFIVYSDQVVGSLVSLMDDVFLVHAGRYSTVTIDLNNKLPSTDVAYGKPYLLNNLSISNTMSGGWPRISTSHTFTKILNHTAAYSYYSTNGPNAMTFTSDNLALTSSLVLGIGDAASGAVRIDSGIVPLDTLPMVSVSITAWIENWSLSVSMGIENWYKHGHYNAPTLCICQGLTQTVKAGHVMAMAYVAYFDTAHFNSGVHYSLTDTRLGHRYVNGVGSLIGLEEPGASVVGYETGHIVDEAIPVDILEQLPIVCGIDNSKIFSSSLGLTGLLEVDPLTAEDTYETPFTGCVVDVRDPGAESAGSFTKRPDYSIPPLTVDEPQISKRVAVEPSEPDAAISDMLTGVVVNTEENDYWS